MALATRELELILIAKDNASSVIARVGGAFVILGETMRRVGMEGIQQLRDMTKEAMEFRQQIALAVTQADPHLKASIEEVAAMSRAVGRDIPIPFEELNEALFDIFSTLDLTSLDQAQDLLQVFAETAVAGQAPIQDIGRAVIAWMNAMNLEPTVGEANKILDVMFELVREGAGTYTEFAGTIGKSIPAYTNAGQSLTTFAGVLAFLTRNGLSAAEASTSAARAVELLFQPKALKNLQEIGIAVEDADGNLREMGDIITDLVNGPFKGLSEAERRIKFKEIFGTGRIQARRFFDLALNNSGELTDLIDQMGLASGKAKDAFLLMLEQPQSQVDRLKNRFALFRQEIGDALIPTLQKHLIPIADRLLDIWENLDPELKKNIAKWASLASVGLVVGGVLTAIVGGLTLISGLLKAFTGKGLISLIARMGVWGIAIAAVAAGAILIIKNWDKVKQFFIDLWDKIKGPINNFIRDNEATFLRWRDKILEIWGQIQELGQAIWQRLIDAWNIASEAARWIWINFGEDIKAFIGNTWEAIKSTVDAALDFIRGLLETFIGLFTGDWGRMWDGIKQMFRATWDSIRTFATFIWNRLKNLWNTIWKGVGIVWRNVWSKARDFFKNLWNGLLNFAKRVWRNIVNFFKSLFNKDVPGAIKSGWRDKIMPFIQDLPGKIIRLLGKLTAMMIKLAGEAFKGFLAQSRWVWSNLIKPFLLDLPFKILNALSKLPNLLISSGKALLRGVLTGVKFIWNEALRPWLKSLPGLLKNLFINAPMWLFAKGKDILRGLKDGVIWIWQNLLKPWWKSLKQGVKDAIGNVSRVLFETGRDILRGLWDGLKDMWNDIWDWLKGLPGKIGGVFNNVLSIFSPSKVMREIGWNIFQGLYNGLKEMWDMKIAPTLQQQALQIQRPFEAQGSFTLPPTPMTNNKEFNVEVNVSTDADPHAIADAILWEIRMA